MVSLATPVYVSVRALTNQLGPDITRGLSGSRRSVQRNGEDLGRAFTSGFNRGVDVNAFRRVANGLRSMVPEADQARKAFSSLVRTSYTLGTALTGVVGGASSVISSLGALAGAAGGAIATVSVLGNAFVALGAGMAAVRLATGGIGGALQKLRQQTSTTAATATRSALQSVRDNQARELATRRIEDAERALARVVEGNRDRLVRANAEIEDAQRSLNEAIRDGREELQQVGFEAEDAALAESRAALELDRAREVLARTQDLPPNDRRRREAEIAYQEAELNYRKAADANADLQKESDRLARTGVNGLSSVIAARNDLADAEADKAQVIKDALQDEEDALRNVAEARADANNVDERQDATGGDGGTPAVAAAGAAWDEGLNDAQRRFALFINSLRPQFDELERIAAEAFLPRLQTAIETLMEKAYPVVAVGIGVVATAMGEAAITLADFITTGENLRTLAVLFDSSGRLIETFGEILGRSYGIILSILEATAPMAERFFTFLDQELTKFDNYLNSTEGNNALVDFFAKAEYTAKQFGDVFGNVFAGIGGIINANIGPGTGGALLLEYFEKATSDWGNSEGLQTFFLNVANNATKVLDTIGELLGILGRLGENQNIGRAFETLLSGAPALENILQTTVDAAPSLAELVVTITEIVSAMSDTGAMQIFFETLNNIFGGVLAFVSDPGNKEFLDFFGRIFAMFSAIGLTTGLLGTGLRILTGVFLGMISPIATVVGLLSAKNIAMVKSKIETGILIAMYGKDMVVAIGRWVAAQAALLAAKIKDIAQTTILLGMYARDAIVKGASATATIAMTVAQKAATAAQWLFNAALTANPIGIVVAAIAALVAGLVWFFTQTELGQEIWANFTRFLTEAWENTTRWIGEALTNLGTFFSDTWNNIVSWVTGAVDFLVDLFLNWTIYGIIIQNWDNIVRFFQDVWNNIMGFFDAAFKWIDTYVIRPMIYAGEILALAFRIMGDQIGDIWEGIMDAINTAWQWIDRYIFTPIRIAVAAIQEYFRLLGVGIGIIWDGIKTAIDNAWKWIDQNIFNPIKTAVGLVQTAFENVALGIANAWDGIKRAAASPINFVIDTVYNNGLRSFWNDIAGALGMNDKKLPRVPTIAFAKGGVLPGYTPGRDVHDFYSRTGGRLRLSGGEAIMRPEWTRAVGGPAAVARMNKAAIRGQAFANGGVFSAPRTQAFAGGGVVDFVGDILSNVGKMTAIVGDFFADPKKAIQKHLVEGLIKPLTSGGGDNMFQQIISAVPVKIADFIGDAVSNFFSAAATDRPAGGVGMGWQAMWNVVKSQFPSATLNDAVRPGSPGYHGRGRAIDTSPRMDIFNYLSKAFPNSRELIYSPANGRQLQNGRNYMWPEPIRSAHFNHVHWAMAKGGTVMPSPGGSIVNIAEAGQPERVEPLDPNGLSERDKAWAALFTKDMPRGDVNITVVQRENEDTEAFAQRVAQIVNDDIRSGSAH